MMAVPLAIEGRGILRRELYNLVKVPRTQVLLIHVHYFLPKLRKRDHKAFEICVTLDNLP